MLSALTKSRLLSQRSIAYGARWASQAPPKGPAGNKPAADSEPAPETQASSSSPLEPDAQAPAGTKSQSLPSLDFMPSSEPEEEIKTTGAKSSSNLTSSDKKRKAASRVMLALLAAGLGAQVVYMGRDFDEDELKSRKLKPEDAPSSRWGRTAMRYNDIWDYFTKPPTLELLPPPPPPPQGKPYTLVLSLDDLLVTSTWDRQHGWRTAKRPGVDYFLNYISQFYEIVIFSSQSGYIVDPIIAQLDRYGWSIAHRLGREQTRTVNGTIAKDLSYINRDLSKVIILDTNPEHVRLQPENAIVIPPWKGDVKDRGLVALIPFLESIGIYNPQDVRPILKAYEGKNIPLEYAKKEAEAKARHIEEWKAKNKGTGAGAGALTSLFGLSSAPSTPRNVPPPTYLEQKRKQAQLQYQQEQKYLADHKEEFEKAMKQQQEEMNAQVPNTLWEALAMVSGGPKPPAPGTEAAAAPSSSSTSSPSTTTTTSS